ncbi:hypothetical protein OSTOST_11845 [Ostertagia ostertagi]
MEKYVLCYPDFAKFVPKKDQGLVWMMRSLRFCEVNQIFAYSRFAHSYHRHFQTKFLKYAYALICDKGRLVAKEEHFDLYLYSSLFKALYERDNMDRMWVEEHLFNYPEQVSPTSLLQANLSTCLRCLLRPLQSMLCATCFETSAKNQRAMFGDIYTTAEISVNVSTFFASLRQLCRAISNMGLALSEDVLFMNLLSSSMVSNIHSDSELPSLVLKTRLVLQNFSVAAIKLWKQIEQVRK